MEKLPATSYVRLVDIWLISIQLVPFLLVVMTTASELFLEDSEETDINHHGMARWDLFVTNEFKWFQLSYRTVKTGFIDPETEKESQMGVRKEKEKGDEIIF